MSNTINKKRSSSQVTPVEAAVALARNDAAVASAANDAAVASASNDDVDVDIDIDDIMERYSPTKVKKTETTSSSSDDAEVVAFWKASTDCRFDEHKILLSIQVHRIQANRTTYGYIAVLHNFYHLRHWLSGKNNYDNGLRALNGFMVQCKPCFIDKKTKKKIIDKCSKKSHFTPSTNFVECDEAACHVYAFHSSQFQPYVKALAAYNQIVEMRRFLAANVTSLILPEAGRTKSGEQFGDGRFKFHNDEEIVATTDADNALLTEIKDYVDRMTRSKSVENESEM